MAWGPVAPSHEGSHVAAPQPFAGKTTRPESPPVMYALPPDTTGDAQSRSPGTSPIHESASPETFDTLSVASCALNPRCEGDPWNCAHRPRGAAAAAAAADPTAFENAARVTNVNASTPIRDLTMPPSGSVDTSLGGTTDEAVRGVGC